MTDTSPERMAAIYEGPPIALMVLHGDQTPRVLARLTWCKDAREDLLAKVAELEEAATLRKVADAGIGTVPIGIKLKAHMEERVAELEAEVERLMAVVSAEQGRE